MFIHWFCTEWPLVLYSLAVPNAYNIPMSRRIVDMWKNNVSPLIYNYPIGTLNWMIFQISIKNDCSIFQNLLNLVLDRNIGDRTMNVMLVLIVNIHSIVPLIDYITGKSLELPSIYIWHLLDILVENVENAFVILVHRIDVQCLNEVGQHQNVFVQNVKKQSIRINPNRHNWRWLTNFSFSCLWFLQYDFIHQHVFYSVCDFFNQLIGKKLICTSYLMWSKSLNFVVQEKMIVEEAGNTTHEGSCNT